MRGTRVCRVTKAPRPLSSPLAPSRRVWRLVGRLLLVLGLLTLGTLAAGGLFLAASRPMLDGTLALPGLRAVVAVERDHDGVPTVHAADADDAARALGFLHAQERFFQMDLLRRRAAGELAELVGPAALPLDRETRRHRFRSRAEARAAGLPPAETRRLDAYAAGVNAGLGALAARPWEYALLRETPRPWTRADSVLVVYAMALDLQGGDGRDERVRLAVSDAYGAAVRDFLWPRVLERTAALDGSNAPVPPIPGAAAWPEKRPTGRHGEPSPGQPAKSDGERGLVAALFPPATPEDRPGSNAFALAGSRAGTGGAALVAGDPHLGLNVPNTWYRVRLEWPGRAVTGVSLPGVPGVILGSNGDVAWAFTNGYIDHSDVVIVDVDPTDPGRYRVPDGEGWERFETVRETLAVAHRPPETLETLHTRWGPVLTRAAPGGRTLALCWVMHAPDAVNFATWDLAEARDVDEAVTVAHRAGIPAQNLLVGDRAGHIAWTIIGRVPHRVGFDGWTAGSWGDGTRRWEGFLAPDEVPVVRDPGNGQLWSSNHRMLGGEALARLGDGGYDDPARAAQVRDRLTALNGRAASPGDLLAVQLDDESRFLRRWAERLDKVLTDDAVRDDAGLAEMRRLLRAWHGHAAADEPGHRLVRQFRLAVLEGVMGPLYGPVHRLDPAATGYGSGVEQPLWSILEERPAHLLPAPAADWEAFLLSAARATAAEVGRDGPLGEATWGRANTLRMRHPLSAALPGGLGRFLDLPADPLPGDSRMPRVQTPTFGASMRMVVAPGHEAEGVFHQPGGASGHPLSPFYRAGHAAWATGQARPFLPGPARYRLTLRP